MLRNSADEARELNPGKNSKPFELARHVDRKRVGQRQDVFGALSRKWRDRDDVEGESVEQVLAKLGRSASQRLEVGIGRADDPHIDVQIVSLPPTRWISPYSIVPQDLSPACAGRSSRVHRESSVPPLCALEVPYVGLGRASKGASLVAEQLGLENRFRQCGAIDLDDVAAPSDPDRKCRRDATSSLPVPRSPTTRTGLERGAARETCSSISRNAGASPMMGCDSGFGRHWLK